MHDYEEENLHMFYVSALHNPCLTESFCTKQGFSASLMQNDVSHVNYFVYSDCEFQHTFKTLCQRKIKILYCILSKKQEQANLI